MASKLILLKMCVHIIVLKVFESMFEFEEDHACDITQVQNSPDL